MYKHILSRMVESIINEDVEAAQAALSEYAALKTRRILEAPYPDAETVPGSRFKNMWRSGSGIFHTSTEKAISSIGIEAYNNIMKSLQQMVDDDLYSTDPGARSLSNVWYDWKDKHQTETDKLPEWVLYDIKKWLTHYADDIWSHADDEDDYTNQTMRQGEMGR